MNASEILPPQQRLASSCHFLFLGQVLRKFSQECFKFLWEYFNALYIILNGLHYQREYLNALYVLI